ncbi:MAG: dihydrofolate reductase family protein [Ekhidna sp.]
MRKLISYIATSLDGKIAKTNGDVSWLHDLPNPENLDYGYASFMESIDTILMGNKTHQVIADFAGEFPYGDKENFVFTRNDQLASDKNVKYVSDDPGQFIRNLKGKTGKDIWLIGGGILNAICLNEGLIDELRVFIMPYVLGQGVSLFANETRSRELELINFTKFSTGVIELTYAPLHLETKQ